MRDYLRVFRTTWYKYFCGLPPFIAFLWAAVFFVRDKAKKFPIDIQGVCAIIAL